MKYVLNTEHEREEMLKKIGASSVMDLFNDIDAPLIQTKPLAITDELSEIEVTKKVQALASKNAHLKSFVGGGCYQHYIPSAINHMLLRGEFYTAYTPYQPEGSQGSLQSIFEFQTFICRLTGQDVANASMYDGSSALAEAASMAHVITGKKKILVSEAIHPHYRAVVRTYCEAFDLEYQELAYVNGITDPEDLKEQMSDEVAGVLVQNPNFFGCVEKLAEIEQITHKYKALLIGCVVEAISLGILEPPRGADIVVGDGQSFGIPMSFGGPAFGFMAVKKKYMRKIPGRLIGQTIDSEGKRGFIMTLTAREQHIRREKATSNLCTNQALLALGATIYLSMVGPQLKDIAHQNIQKTQYAKKEVLGITGFEGAFTAPVFNEFVVKVPDAQHIIEYAESKGVMAGLKLAKHYPELKDHLLVCVTESHTKEDIDLFVELLKEAVAR